MRVDNIEVSFRFSLQPLEIDNNQNIRCDKNDIHKVYEKIYAKMMGRPIVYQQNGIQTMLGMINDCVSENNTVVVKGIANIDSICKNCKCDIVNIIDKMTIDF